jgi:erythromycin esterase-like protein
LAMRNRLIRYGVTRLGFTAVALETCLSPSKRLYDHVLGRTTETDSALKEASAMGSVTFRRTSNSFDGCVLTTPPSHPHARFTSMVSI